MKKIIKSKILVVFLITLVLIVAVTNIIKAAAIPQEQIGSFEMGKQYNITEIASLALGEDIGNFEWEVSNEEVVTISESGVIIPLKKGSATVTLSSDGEDISYSFNIINGIEDAKRMYTICGIICVLVSVICIQRGLKEYIEFMEELVIASKKKQEIQNEILKIMND